MDHSPDAASVAVAAGVFEIDFVVADDLVVKVEDVERSVGAALDRKSVV